MASSQTTQIRRFRSKDEKLVKRFYEPLVLLEVLDTTQGDRIPQQTFESEDHETRDKVTERRTILNHLATVCDFDKGGLTVTALALERLPAGPAYWISSPSKLESKIVPFLHQTLRKLLAFVTEDAGPMGQRDMERELFQDFTRFCMLRLLKTWKIMQKLVDEEIEQTDSEGRFADP